MFSSDHGHILLGIALLALIDFVTLMRTQLSSRRRDYEPPPRGLSEDFAILIPIFGHVKYLKNARTLSRYGERVVICTTDEESADFYQSLYKMSREFGFRVFVSPTSSASVSANQFAILSRSVVQCTRRVDQIRDEIVRNSSGFLTASTTILLDGDTVPTEDLRVLVAAFEDLEYDLASVRVVPYYTDTIAERLQEIEYDLAMRVRWVYPWLTSGAATVGRTTVLRRLMASHSLFFSGGDIELGKLACMMGFTVGHIPAEFRTVVPKTLRAWYRQRARGWCIGKFRHAIVNMDRPGWRAPFFSFYQTVAIYVLLPLRWYVMIHNPEYLLVVWPVYCLLLFMLRPDLAKPLTILFPLFAYTQVMVAIPEGACRYVAFAARKRYLGRIKVRPLPNIPAVIDLNGEQVPGVKLKQRAASEVA